MPGWRAPLQRALVHPAAKPLGFALGLAPLAWLVWAVWADALGANPAEAVIRQTGEWTLQALCLALAVTPVREASGLAVLARFRRSIGLFTFFYGTLHALAFAWLDQGLDPQAILADVGKRPFILVGTLAWLAMLPLALTSFNAAIRSLGAVRWKLLHRAVYAVGLLAVLHFFWMRAGKNVFGEVAVYAAVVGLLLGWRVWRRLRAPARLA